MNNEERRLAEHLAQLRLSLHSGKLSDLWLTKPLASSGLTSNTSDAFWKARANDAKTAPSPAGLRRRVFPSSKPSISSTGTGPKRSTALKCSICSAWAFSKTKPTSRLVGGVGLGKSHLAIALGHAACLQGHSVLFTTAVEAINSLAAAQAQSRLKAELKKFLAPSILVCDELGYLPIDKNGADLLFQIISGRYEKGSTIITTNQIYKHWSRIFNNDATITSAVLDRLLHHAETVIVEGKSYRTRDRIEEP